jgi:hypothetical protein
MTDRDCAARTRRMTRGSPKCHPGALIIRLAHGNAGARTASQHALTATSLEKREGNSPINLDCGVGILHQRRCITGVRRRGARASEGNPLTRLNSDPPRLPRPTTTKTKRCDESQDSRLSDIELRSETDQFWVPYLAQTKVWTPSGVLPETLAPDESGT